MTETVSALNYNPRTVVYKTLIWEIFPSPSCGLIDFEALAPSNVITILDKSCPYVFSEDIQFLESWDVLAINIDDVSS